MSVGDTPDVLITIPISHFCEKARWALDRSGLSYVERPHLQVFHWAAVRRAGGGKFPLVGVVVHDHPGGELAEVAQADQTVGMLPRTL